MILGPSIIGDNSLIFPSTIIGFVRREKLKSLQGSGISSLDELSGGVRLGSNVVVRSGTIIYEDVLVGNNVETGHNVLIRENTEIMDGTLIGSGSIIDGYVRIGGNCSIQSGVYIPKNTLIGDNVFLGPRVTITNDKYPPSRRLLQTVIGSNSVIGANATIIAGIKVGEYAVVAAGAVVTKDVPPRKVVAGVPAKVIGDREDYELKKHAYEEYRV